MSFLPKIFTRSSFICLPINLSSITCLKKYVKQEFFYYSIIFLNFNLVPKIPILRLNFRFRPNVRLIVNPKFWIRPCSLSGLLPLRIFEKSEHYVHSRDESFRKPHTTSHIPHLQKTPHHTTSHIFPTFMWYHIPTFMWGNPH